MSHSRQGRLQISFAYGGHSCHLLIHVRSPRFCSGLSYNTGQWREDFFFSFFFCSHFHSLSLFVTPTDVRSPPPKRRPLAVIILTNHSTTPRAATPGQRREWMIANWCIFYANLPFLFLFCLMTDVIICKRKINQRFISSVCKHSDTSSLCLIICARLWAVCEKTVLLPRPALLCPDLYVHLCDCINLNCLRYTVCQCVNTTGAKWSDRRLNYLFFSPLELTVYGEGSDNCGSDFFFL